MERLNTEVKKLTREVKGLEEKCAKTKNPADDKLAIYKSQAAMISKKKEQVFEQIRKCEEEERNLDKQIAEKEGENTQNIKGFKTKDEYKAYTNMIKSKNATYKKMKAMITDVRSETAVLQNTERLLKIRADETEITLRSKEKEKGMEGITDKLAGMEGISEN